MTWNKLRYELFELGKHSNISWKSFRNGINVIFHMRAKGVSEGDVPPQKLEDHTEFVEFGEYF